MHKNIDDTSYIVSGFPRSGTSMMMRMLSFGGLEALATAEHFTSPATPYGLMELEETGEIHDMDTAGKVLKLVAPYIESLPVGRKMKVIFMIRDLHEIIASLMAMKTIWEFDPIQTVKYARDFLAHHNVPTHLVHYKEAMKYPRSIAMGIVDFLGMDLNIDEMIKAVDPDARHVVKPKNIEEDDPRIIQMLTSKRMVIKEVLQTEFGKQM